MKPWIVLLAASTAAAGTLGDVTLPDQAQVGDQVLVLNGMGLREMLFVDVYVGALYLPSRTKSATDAIQNDVPKRIVMHIIFPKVTRQQSIDTFKEHLDRNPDIASLGDRVTRLYGFMEDLTAGDEVVLDYVPGTGTTVSVRGKVKGTVEGADLMRAIWSIFLGPKPASQKLKTGMLRGA